MASDQLPEPRAALGIGGADVRRVRLRASALLHVRTAVCNRIGSVFVGGRGPAAGVVQRSSVSAGSDQQPAQRHMSLHVTPGIKQGIGACDAPDGRRLPGRDSTV